jgi:histidinol-phosphate aminotransferase
MTLPATVPFVGPEAQERRAAARSRADRRERERVRPLAARGRRDAARGGRGLWKYGDPEAHDLRAPSRRITGSRRRTS